jgi:hypothetical protein
MAWIVNSSLGVELKCSVRLSKQIEHALVMARQKNGGFNNARGSSHNSG